MENSKKKKVSFSEEVSYSNDIGVSSNEVGSSSNEVGVSSNEVGSSSNEVGSFSSVCYTAEEFRKQLCEEEVLPYIRDFFFNNNDENNVSNYIKNGGSVSEIANSLGKIDLKRREQSTILFSALHLVIIKSITELTDSSQFEDECRQFIANYIGELQSILTSNTIQKQKKVVLKLLASIAVVSPRLASQILTTLSLSKDDLDILTPQTNPGDEQSLRISFIHFVLSFIIDQSPKIIEKLLGKKTWLPSIFPELKYDLPFTVQLVLSTLEDKIVNNVNISKTSKLLAFNASALFHLSQLYSWNPKEWFDSRPHKTTNVAISEDESSAIRMWTHNLLSKICTSSKLGIVFQDTSYGTSNLQKNYTLCNFFQRLNEPWEDKLKKELLFKTLITCPDVIKSVLHSLGPNLKTFSTKWLEIVEFITEISYWKDIDIEEIVKLRMQQDVHIFAINILNNVKINLKSQSLKVCLDTIHDLIVPKQLLESIKGGSFLSGESISLRINAIKFISNMLSNYCKVYNEIKQEHSEILIQSQMTPFFIQHLPSALQLLDHLSKSYDNKEQNMINEIIKLFILYEKACPTLVDLVRFDDSVTKWIEEKISGDPSEEDSLLILSLIRLEIIIYPHDPYQDKFLSRLKWTTYNQVEENKEIAIDILKELLEKSGLFIRSPDELALWMYCIETYLSSDIGKLIADSMQFAQENTNDIYKMLLKAQEQSATEEVSGLNLNDFLKISGNDSVPVLQDESPNSILHLSPLLPSMLHVLSDVDTNCDDFLVAFLILNFHRQASVPSYVSLLTTFSSSCVKKAMPYLESWLVRPITIDIPPLSNSIFSKVSKFILNGKGNIEEIKTCCRTKQEAEIFLDECIFIACELSRLKKATPERLERILELIKSCFVYEGLKINASHPALLLDFHPLRNVGDSNLTHLVLAIAENINTSQQFLEPLSHRLAFELKYAKKTVQSLDDESKLLKLFEIFRFSRSDVKDLVDYVFSLKNKYFEINGKLSPWAAVTVHLLSLATEYKIIISDEKLILFLDTITYLINNSFNIFELISVFLKYLNEVFTDISGILLDSFKDLFYVLCMSTSWYEDFCVHIFHYMDDVDFSIIPVEKSVTLIASLKDFKKKYRKVLTDSSGIIYQALCVTPSPKWLSDLLNLKPIIPVEECKKICKRVKKHPKEITPSVETLRCIEMFFMKSDEVYSLYSLILTWLGETMNSNAFDQTLSEKLSEILSSVLESEIDKTALETVDNNLVLSLLLQGLKIPSSPMLDLIHSLVKYNSTKLPPGEIFELLCSHSCFLDVLLSTSVAKYSALNLLHGLLKKDNSLINSTHVPVLLSSYNATLSKVDQIIFKILQMYEKVGGINLACWKPYVWGEAAVDHYSVRSKISPIKSNPLVTLELFEKDIVQATITKFPLKRGLDNDFEDDSGLYDPAFYLPLLSQLVGETPGGWKVAGSGAIGLTLASLASEDPQVRAAAYHILFRFYSFIPNHKDNMIWKHFIEALRGGVVGLGEGDNVRLSSLVTTFLARASIIMSTPDDPLYFTLHNFVYAKPHLKLNTVPAFLEMFHSTRGNHRLHQRWLLEVLRDGIREQRDLQIALNSLTFKFILDFHSCSLASPKAKELIEALVLKCLQIVDEKQLLINNYSIIPWIVHANPKIVKEIPTKILNQYLPLKNFYFKEEAESLR